MIDMVLLDLHFFQLKMALCIIAAECTKSKNEAISSKCCEMLQGFSFSFCYFKSK